MEEVGGIRPAFATQIPLKETVGEESLGKFCRSAKRLAQR